MTIKRFFIFGILIFSIKGPSFAMMDEEEKSSSQANTNLHREIFLEEGDKRKLENYIKDLGKKNIEVKKAVISEEKKFKLTFSPKGWHSFLFSTDFTPVFILLSHTQSSSFVLNMPSRRLNTDELNAAINAAKINTSFVECIYDFTNDLGQWSSQRFCAQSLLRAFTLRNAGLRGLLKNLSYNFSNFSKDNDDETMAIAECIEQSLSLREIMLYFNGNSEKTIIKALKNNKQIQSLEIFIFGRSLNHEDSKDIASLCLNNTSLMCLRLGCTLNDNLVSQLTDVLGHSLPSLETLALTFNGQKLPIMQVSPENIQSFFQSLKENNNLRTLQINFPIDLSAAQTLSESLKLNKKMQVLTLTDCDLEDYSIALLSEGMEKNTFIHTVDFSRNYITDKGADSLIKMLESNLILKNIYLGENKVSMLKIETINSKLDENRRR